MTRIMGTLHDDVFTFIIISCFIFLTRKNISVKFVEKHKIHVLGFKTFSYSPLFYESMWKYMVERDRPQMTI
jgi:hypothetical protein